MLQRKPLRTQILINGFLAFFALILILNYNKVYYELLTHLKMSLMSRTNETIPSQTILVATDITPLPPPPVGYLVWSENCHMPSADPFDNDYLKTYEPNIEPNCTETQALVFKSFNTQTDSYMLHINMDLKYQYLNDTEQQADDYDIECCYKEILREGDMNYKLLECEPFAENYIVPNNISYILIECSASKNSSNSTIVYKDAMSFIQKNLPTVNEKIENNKGRHRPYGILLFGIDTISQFNFRRVMPHTFAYVQNKNWYELSGYNKIEDNTFPNLMAIFTGLNLSLADDICHYHVPGGLDNCTTLFNLFNQQGMITAYSEDTCEMSTFDYLKPGFQTPPTDYYQRPLLLAAEKELPIKKLSGLQYCLGPRRYGEYVYDFGVEFAERFVGEAIFGLFWTNSFSHNDWIDPATMDERMVEYFNYMDAKKILDNNVVILFSDHGARWGFLRNQKEGYIEERLPMFFMRLPEWFQEGRPDIIQAMVANKNRLTSPYDIHVTLKQLALMSLGKKEGIELPLSCLTCQTVFEPVPENRTCEMAGIDEHWCTCTPFESLDCNTEEMTNLTKLVIDEMNLYLNQSIFANYCQPLQFKENVEANLRLDLHQNAHTSQMQTYRMNFIVNPNEAVFDATFVYDTETKTISVEVTEISRLNSYAKDSVCVDDNVVKKYCICKESIQSR